MRSFFVTSSGTDVGKSHMMATLCWQLKQSGKKVTALKPIMSGYNDEFLVSDAATILTSCGLTPTAALIETISPWRYKAPLAPNMAAAAEGRPQPQLADVASFCRDHSALANDVLLVEGVGGVMVPMNDEHTMLDLMQNLAWPAIIVVGSYLGTISHTLTAIEVLKNRGITIHALVVNQSPNSDVRIEDTVSTFEKFIPESIPILKLPRSDKPEPWKHMPLISWIAD